MKFSNMPIDYITVEEVPSDIYSLEDNESLFFIMDEDVNTIKPLVEGGGIFSPEELNKLTFIQKDDADVEVANIIMEAASNNRNIFYVKLMVEEEDNIRDMFEHATPNVVVLQ